MSKSICGLTRFQATFLESGANGTPNMVVLDAEPGATQEYRDTVAGHILAMQDLVNQGFATETTDTYEEQNKKTREEFGRGFRVFTVTELAKKMFGHAVQAKGIN